jgi:addiction module HigA family antidote
MAKTLAPVHPGEILAEDFMAPIGLTANQLALSLRIPANRITAIIAGKLGITADTALRLARYFGTSAEVWMGLQADFDLQRQTRNGDRTSGAATCVTGVSVL